MIHFIDRHSDLNTVNYLAKSLDSECLIKALDRTGLVQKEVQYKTQTGKIATRKQWVKAGEEQSTPAPKKPVKEQQKEKRPQIPATPFNITERTKHLVPIESVSEIPEHIKKMGKPIPPGWRCVMISPDPNADILAVGKDDMNRPQYRYSTAYTAKTTAKKFNRVNELIQRKDALLDAINILKEDDPDTADCLDLIYHMGIRPGSTTDTKAKKEALGATTLRGENVVQEDNNVYLRFTGKDGVYQDHEVTDDHLKQMLLQRKEQAGDTGDLFNTTNRKLLATLKPLGIKTKDLRTMLANTTAQEFLADIEPTDDPKEFARIRDLVGEHVAGILGNQKSMSLNSYIDPSVFEKWSPDGMAAWKAKKQKAS